MGFGDARTEPTRKSGGASRKSARHGGRIAILVVGAAALGSWSLLAPGDSRADPPEFVALTAWAVPSTTKVLKDAQPKGENVVFVEAARNEYVGFQIALAAGESTVTGVNLELSDLSGPDGAVISQVNATRYREYYVEVTEPSWCETVFSPSCEEIGRAHV